jgi:hypothetical protein
LIDDLQSDVQQLAMHVDHALLVLDRLRQMDHAEALLGDIADEVRGLRDRAGAIAGALIEMIRGERRPGS